MMMVIIIIIINHWNVKEKNGKGENLDWNINYYDDDDKQFDKQTQNSLRQWNFGQLFGRFF